MPLPREKKPRRAKPRRPKAATWTSLEQYLEKLEGTWCEGEVLNLPGWRTIKYRETAGDVIVLAELTTEIGAFCVCRPGVSKIRKWGFTEPSHVRDVPVRCKRTRIYYRVQRERCLKCRKTGRQTLAGVDEKHSMTDRLVEYVGRESFNIFRNFAGVADEVGCHELTVRKIYTARALRLETGRVVEAPRWIAIDEVYPRKHGTPRCVISDPERRKVLDLLADDRNERLLWRWLLRLKNRNAVEAVTIDMCPAYRKAVRRLLPQAQIVVDRYHVHNMLNVALKGVLEVIRDGMTPAERERYMKRETLLLKNRRRLSDTRGQDDKGKELPSEKELVQKWLRDVPDLARAYRLKSDFSDILQLSDRQKAEARMDPWLDRVCKFVEHFRTKYRKKYSGLWADPFGNVPNTFAEWRASILNYIDHKKSFSLKATNAFAEYANKQIKRAYKVGNGYSHAVLRVKVVHGGVLVGRRPPHPLDEKWKRKKWDRATRKGCVSTRAVNPESNIALLEKAWEEQDGAKKLLPDPEKTAGWRARFGCKQPKRRLTEAEKLRARLAKEIGDVEAAGRGRRRFKHNSAQLNMF
jgi:transposase